MQKRKSLQFHCLSCKDPVPFSIFELEDQHASLECRNCNKKYSLSDETLIRQLKKFEALCRQLIESEEILAHTAVGIDVGEHHVKVPYRILLTRLSSTLDLMIGNQPVSISFRIEPLKDLPALDSLKDKKK